MIDNLELILENDILAAYEKDGKADEIRLEDIRPYWDYANEDDIEGARLYVRDERIVALLSVASGQGGVVVIWDAESRRIVHVSEAAYAVAADLFDGYVYTLSAIQNFETTFTAKLSKSPVGTMDAFKESEVEDFEFDKIEDYDGNYDHIDLQVEADRVIIWIEDKSYTIARS